MIAYAYAKQNHNVRKQISLQQLKLLSTYAIYIQVSYKMKHCNNQYETTSKNEVTELLRDIESLQAILPQFATYSYGVTSTNYSIDMLFKVQSVINNYDFRQIH